MTVSGKDNYLVMLRSCSPAGIATSALWAASRPRAWNVSPCISMV